jgi:hypothetical protein
METQKPYMMSLYEYLGRAAGPELGKQVADTAKKLQETIKEQDVSNPKYTASLRRHTGHKKNGVRSASST